METERKYKVDPSDDCTRRLDVFLARIWGDYSRTNLQQHIKSGAIKVGGVVVKPGYTPAPGDEITFIPLETEPEDSAPSPENIPVHILYSDEHIIVVNKPADMVVHPSRGHFTGTLVNALLWRFPDLSGGGDSARPGIVHRLDIGTSGVMVVARTGMAHAALGSCFRDRTVKKTYDAIVWGRPDGTDGVVDVPVGRSMRDRTKMAVRGIRSRQAETAYRVAEYCSWMTRLEVKPATGRTHQIRVHLQYAGYPIVADPQYGADDSILLGQTPAAVRGALLSAARAIRRPALHARAIEFEHPATGAAERFEAPWPDDFTRLAEAVRQAALLEGRTT